MEIQLLMPAGDERLYHFKTLFGNVAYVVSCGRGKCDHFAGASIGVHVFLVTVDLNAILKVIFWRELEGVADRKLIHIVGPVGV